MAVIQLKDTTPVFPEGEYVFRIDMAIHEEKKGRINVKLVTDEGKILFQSYYIVKKDGTPNDYALIGFSYLAKAALDDKDATEIDPVKLKGKYIQAEVQHNISDNGKKFATLYHIKPSQGFTEPKTDTLDIDDLF